MSASHRLLARCLATSLFLICLASPVASSPAEPEPTGSLGCLAVRGGEVIEELEPEKRKIPASVQKLAISAAALHFLGPEYQTKTRVLVNGSREEDTLKGDLVIVAGGDPTWSRRFYRRAEQAFDPIVRALSEAGIRRVVGQIVIDLSRFPGRPAPASRALNEIAFGFGAQTSALAVDENILKIKIAAADEVGKAPTVQANGLRVVNLATTVGADRHGKGTVDFQPVWYGSQLILRGEYPISEPPYEIELGVADGEQRAARCLNLFLKDSGIEVTGGVRLSHRPMEGDVLTEMLSLPLAEWLPPILSESENWLTEMTLRLIAAEELGQGRLEDGLELVERFLSEEVGVAEGSVSLDDASGVSPYNLWTPRAVVTLLDWSWRQPWQRSFLEALAEPDRGTLTAWPNKLPRGLRAKTGTQRHALGLAGYLAVDGFLLKSAEKGIEPLIFACLMNQETSPRAVQRRHIALRLWRWHKLLSP